MLYEVITDLDIGAHPKPMGGGGQDPVNLFGRHQRRGAAAEKDRGQRSLPVPGGGQLQMPEQQLNIFGDLSGGVAVNGKKIAIGALTDTEGKMRGMISDIAEGVWNAAWNERPETGSAYAALVSRISGSTHCCRGPSGRTRR